MAIDDNVRELAWRLHGRQYRREMARVEEQGARILGLVVAFGASDHLMEFRGAINDEVGCYNGRDVLIDSEGPLRDFDQLVRDRDGPGIRDYFRREARARKITAKWDTDGYAWTYETEIPHATFEIMDEGEKYCRGMVFRLADVERV